MYKNLNVGAIGIHGLGLPAVIELAAATGFSGIDFDIRAAAALADEIGMAELRALFARHQVQPGSWGLPVAWNQPQWEDDLTALPELAALGAALGCPRTATWCPSWSDERAYAENLAWHVDRFRPIATVLAEQGCMLGIEFLGPQTLRANHPYAFVGTLAEMNELLAAIGTGNVGHLLDAWHLYASGGTAAELAGLTAADIVTVHINDAPPNVPVTELLDTKRHLPLETGVIDLVGFMQQLQQLGYTGPVTVEPFNQALNELAAADPTAAAQQVAAAMDQLWQKAGV